MNKKITKADFAKSLEESVKWLWEKKCGCCHIVLVTDDKDREWCIAMGWLDGFDESEHGEYQSGTWNICVEIGFHDKGNFMFTDLGWDLTMPYNEESGEVDDTTFTLYDEPDWNKLADELNKEAERVISEWAYFEPEEKEEVA